MQQGGTDGYEVWLVIVPAQAELLHRHCQRQRWNWRLRKQQHPLAVMLPLPRTLSRGSNNKLSKCQQDTSNEYQDKPTNNINSKKPNDENTLITKLFIAY